MIYSAISPTGGWIGTAIFVLLIAAAVALFGIRVGKLIALLRRCTAIAPRAFVVVEAAVAPGWKRRSANV